jgi:6-phosphogluconate dehydrogenase
MADMPEMQEHFPAAQAVEEAIALDGPAPVITLSLIQRLPSRDTQSFSDKLLAAMGNEFGGHAVVKE